MVWLLMSKKIPSCLWCIHAVFINIWRDAAHYELKYARLHTHYMEQQLICIFTFCKGIYAHMNACIHINAEIKYDFTNYGKSHPEKPSLECWGLSAPNALTWIECRLLLSISSSFWCHISFIHFINYVCVQELSLDSQSQTVSERRNVNQDFGQQETNLESIQSTALAAHRRASFAHRARLLHPRPIGNESVRLNNLSKRFVQISRTRQCGLRWRS